MPYRVHAIMMRMYPFLDVQQHTSGIIATCELKIIITNDYFFKKNVFYSTKHPFDN